MGGSRFAVGSHNVGQALVSKPGENRNRLLLRLAQYSDRLRRGALLRAAPRLVSALIADHSNTSVSKRINVMLPHSTLQVLERVAPKGNRSRLISQAILHYVKSRGTQTLRERLKEGYLQNSRLNLEIAQEWFPLEEEIPSLGSGGGTHAARLNLRCERRPSIPPLRQRPEWLLPPRSPA